MTLEELRDKYKNDIGEIVINQRYECVKLIDIEEDSEDFYWIFQKRDGTIEGHSAVGKFYPLKGALSDDDYCYIKGNIETNIRMRESFHKKQ